jgi:hypothetical protein
MQKTGIASFVAALISSSPAMADDLDPAAPAGSEAPKPSAGPSPGDSVYTEELLSALGQDVPELGFELHGFVNLEYYALANDPEHPNNTFDIHNVFLSTRAHVGPKVKLFVELEYEHGSTIKLDRAFLDYKVGEPLTVRIGRFSSPLSYERVHYAAPVRLMTSRPMMVDIAFHEWVDTGIEGYGRIGDFGYNLAIVNGPRGLTEQGIANEEVIDNNRNKAVIARVNYYPAQTVETGIAATAGTYDPEGRLWFYIAEADARVRRGRWDVWGEAQFRTGDDEPCDSATDPMCDPAYAGDHARKLGYYVAASYAVLENARYAHYLKPIVRYDELDDLETKAGRRRVAAGLNWSPYPHAVVKSELQVTIPTDRMEVVGKGVMMSAVADF